MFWKQSSLIVSDDSFGPKAWFVQFAKVHDERRSVFNLLISFLFS